MATEVLTAEVVEAIEDCVTFADRHASKSLRRERWTIELAGRGVEALRRLASRPSAGQSAGVLDALAKYTDERDPVAAAREVAGLVEQLAHEHAAAPAASDDPAREVTARVLAWMEGHVDAITYSDDAGETHEWEPPLAREDATLVGQLAAFVVPAAAPAAPEVPRG